MKYLVLLLIPFTINASPYVKQVGDAILISDKTKCFGVLNPNGPADKQLAPSYWMDVDEVAATYDWPAMPNELRQECVFTWKVKPNSRRADGARPIRNITTNKTTGQYIPKETPCGDRASPDYRDYWRIVPGGMAVCEQ